MNWPGSEPGYGPITQPTRQPRYVLWAIVISFTALGLLVAGLFLVGRRAVTQGEALVTRFHDQLRAGKIEEIVAEADPDIANQPKLLREPLVEVQQKLGKPVSASNLNFHRSLNKEGSFLALKYFTAYEKGSATESFTFRYHEGKPRLYFYRAEIEVDDEAGEE